MEFPLVPTARAVRSTAAPLSVAVSSVLSVAFALMAAAILVANCVVLTAVLPDQYGKVVADAVPFAPPLSVVPPQVIPVKLSAVPYAFAVVPGERAVTVITAPVDVAETPVNVFCNVVLALMAAAIFAANCVGVAAAFTDHQGKFVAEAVPSEPPVRVPLPQAKPVMLVVLA